MQLPSLHLLPCTWLTACKLAATQTAEGKTHTLTLARAHFYKPSCCESLILISPNPTHQQSKHFVLLGELLVLQDDRLFGSMKQVVAADSTHGLHLCHWSVAFREQLFCSDKKAKKEGKETKYLQEKK